MVRYLRNGYHHGSRQAKMHTLGAPFQWCGIFHKSDIVFTKGTEGLTFYSSQDKSRDYQLPTKVACSHCRSPIMDEGRNVCLVFPELIDYEASEKDHDEWRRAFAPKYVHTTAWRGIPVTIRLMSIDYISSTPVAQWKSQMGSRSGRHWTSRVSCWMIMGIQRMMARGPGCSINSRYK